MDYRVQRLKEDLTNAQQRNKKQRIQLANYKKCHERDLGTIKKQKEVIDKAIDKLGRYATELRSNGDAFAVCVDLLDILKEVE